MGAIRFPAEVVETIRRVTAITLLGLGTGCVAAVAAVGFVDAVSWLNDTLLISPRSRMLVGDSGWLTVATLAVPTIGGLLVGWLCLAIPERRPHGPADAIRAAQNFQETMPVRSGALTAVAACLSLGVGASVGQYGPLAHMGAFLGHQMSRLVRFSRYAGTIGIGCGAAAAIATAFNAPIAGLVFAHEVILRHYSLRAFAPVTVAATMGYVAANVVFERPPLFRIEQVEIGSPYEFLVFIAIGLVGAVLAMLFMRAVLAAGELSARIALPLPLKTAAAGLCTGIIALQIPDILGIGKEVLRFAVIENAFTPVELVTILVAKLLLTALCLGFGFAGGVFSPALLIGILFGALVGTGAEWMFGADHSPIAIYAVCGMVAVSSAVIGAPLTSILIVFELTRNYDLATAAMVSVAFANLLGYRIFGRSLFDLQLRNRGFDLSFGRDKVIVERQKLEPFVSRDYTRVRDTDSLARVRDALLDDDHGEAYVVDAQGAYMGTVSMNRLMAQVKSGGSLDDPAASHAEHEALTFSPDDSIWHAMTRLKGFVGESVPVLRDGRLLGVVFEASIVDAYLRAVEEIRNEENAAA